MNLAEAYDLIAERWDEQNGSMNEWTQSALQAFTDGLPGGADVLDVGCGSGRFSAALDVQGFRPTGIDVSPKMIELARKKVPNGTFEVMDMRDAASLGRVFDGVLACASLLHVPRTEAPGVLRRLSGLCREDGRIYLAVMKPRPDRPLEEVATDDRFGTAIDRFFSHFHPEEIRAWLSGMGRRPVWERESTLRDTFWYEIVAA